ncbi:MFS transporter [Salicibibacter cibarius]|uniref:MFS transporter n=1 Tax=Salicibibacter cibarius TaxID=2743000 RepID=A0A7T6Z3W1_9BACI|nr:MFS transporter [Salicibibacter cibarius]QQK76419.1 MFS transporter [Salicibibacter cibarius]
MIIIPKWYFGWNIVGAAAVITLLTVGMRMGVGPFVLPIMEDLNFTRTELSTIIAVGMIVYGIGMPIAGYLVEKYSTNMVLILGIIIVTISCVWTVLAQHPLNFFMAFGVFLSFGLAFTSPVALTPIISRWFTKLRGRALFYLSTGSMAGIAIMTPVFSFLIERFGWQATILLFGAAFLIIIVPTTIFIIRDHPPESASLPDVKQNAPQDPSPALTWKKAIATPPFWLIAFGLFTCGFSMNLLGTHGVPMLQDHGFAPITASFAIGLIGIVAIPSTLFLGVLSDKVQRKHLLALIYFVRGLGMVALVIVTVTWQLYLVAAIAGIVWAGSIALSSAILSDVYGVRLVGLLYGWTYFGHQIGAMLSSWLGGWGYDTYGTHLVSFGVTGILLVAASIVSLYLSNTFKRK